MSNKNNNIKNILIYGFFFLFPVLGPITPEFDFALGRVNADMLWLFLLTGISVYVILKKKIYYSQVVKFIALYYIFIFLNAWLNGYFGKINKTDIALYISSLFVFLLIDNLKYEFNDINKIQKLFIILVIITFISSLLQIFYDPSLFMPADRFYVLSKTDFRGFWRHGSIFDSLIQNQGGIFFIFSMFVFLSQYKFGKINKFIDLFSIILLLIIGYLTFTRYIIISQVIIILFFLFNKYAENFRKVIVGSFLLFFFFIVAYIYVDYFISSSFIQDRLLSDASGRTTDPLDFLTQYLSQHNMISGVGISSYLTEYHYGNIRRLHSGVWDLFYQGGIIGLGLWLSIVYQFHKKSYFLYKNNKNRLYLLVAPLIIFINLTAQLNHFFYLGYILIYFLITIEQKIILEKENKLKYA